METNISDKQLLLKYGIKKIMSDFLSGAVDPDYDFDSHSVWIKDNGDRILVSKDRSYSMLFFKSDGCTVKWGSTLDDTPEYCAFGTELADIEITTACEGIRDRDGIKSVCPFCYKSNNAHGKNMSFSSFKKIFDLLDQPKTMTQIALGADAGCSMNPDVWKMMDYCIENNVTPNITVADIDQPAAEKIVSRCGACAVSCYQKNKDRCYNSIRMLTDEALKQKKTFFRVNMHLLLADENKAFIDEVIEDIMSNERLLRMNAVVLLSLKQKGRGSAFHRLEDEDYSRIISRFIKEEIPFGTDSCGANRLDKYLKENKSVAEYAYVSNFIEECEALRGSIYVNTDGIQYPCSFMEGETEGINLLDDSVKDFIQDVWNSPANVKWRENALKCIECEGMNRCPYYKI